MINVGAGVALRPARLAPPVTTLIVTRPQVSSPYPLLGRFGLTCR